jgi:hypothetical protein
MAATTGDPYPGSTCEPYLQCHKHAEFESYADAVTYGKRNQYLQFSVDLTPT